MASRSRVVAHDLRVSGSMRYLPVVLAALLAACGTSPQETREQSARLRASIEKYRAEYLQSIETENRLIPETIVWLAGSALTAPRAQAVAEARDFMDRWARVYFVPRYMHGQLRSDEYSSAEVKELQRRMLDGLKRRYFELHDYQRYAQYASESEMGHTPAGLLSKELQEFRKRLQARAPAVDEIGPVLNALP
jgi:hypothetical protein